MTSLISFIIVLGILIFVHEFGHFLCAKLFGVKVLKFSLGFGPKLAGFQRGETEYVISALPLGGFVKMVGEQGSEEIAPEDQVRSFAHKAVWQRFIIVAAGPVFNLLFAVFIFFMVFAINGLPKPVENSVIGGVSAGSPAERAGLKPGDVITAINGKPTATWEEVAELVSASQGDPLTLEIKRGAGQLTLTAKAALKEDRDPLFGEARGQRYMLGISRSDEVVYEPVSLWTAFTAGFNQTWGFIYLTILGIIKMFQAVIPASELGGPILIAQLAGKQLHQGWTNLAYFMGLISVNLGILNLFPIPILDGGHLMFFTYEAIRRKPMSQRAMEICQQVGLAILASLMLFVFYNDIARLFHQG
jgi:regulator of sigma E protease